MYHGLVMHFNEFITLAFYSWPIVAGRVEKPEHISTKDKTALKVAAKDTPISLSNEGKKRPISKRNKKRNQDARKYLASGELAAEDMERRKERDLRTLYVR